MEKQGGINLDKTVSIILGSSQNPFIDQEAGGNMKMNKERVCLAIGRKWIGGMA